MSRTIVLTSLVSAALALVAGTAYAGGGATTAASLAGPFIGSYSATLTTAQASARGDSRMAGKFTLKLRRNGTYTVTNPLDGASHGRLAALPNKRLRFFADTGCTFGGFERKGGGIYRWSLNAGRLTLRLVSEGPCTGRTQSLTYPVWKRR